MNEHDSFLNYNLDQVPELSTVQGGREYKLKCVDAKVQESKGDKTPGQSLLLCTFDIMDEPDTKRVTYPIMLVSELLDEEKNNSRKRQLKRMVEAMGFDLSQGFNVTELIGEEVWAILDEKEEDPQWGTQNSIVRFVNPQ